MTVTLAFEPARVVLKIEYDGRGIEPGAGEGTSERYGLRGMRERAERFGGRVSWGSREEGGGRVIVEMPRAG